MMAIGNAAPPPISQPPNAARKKGGFASPPNGLTNPRIVEIVPGRCGLLMYPGLAMPC